MSFGRKEFWESVMSCARVVFADIFLSKSPVGKKRESGRGKLSFRLLWRAAGFQVPRTDTVSLCALTSFSLLVELQTHETFLSRRKPFPRFCRCVSYSLWEFPFVAASLLACVFVSAHVSVGGLPRKKSLAPVAHVLSSMRWGEGMRTGTRVRLCFLLSMETSLVYSSVLG